MRIIGRLVVVSLLLACMAPAAAAGDDNPVVEADRAFARATAEKGVEGFAAFMAEDVWLLVNGGSITKGKEAAVESWRGLLTNPDLTISWDPVLGVLSESGDMGYTVGLYVIRGKNSEGKPVEQHGKYVTIWRKQADGSWKVILDGGNTNPAPESAPE